MLFDAKQPLLRLLLIPLMMGIFFSKKYWDKIFYQAQQKEIYSKWIGRLLILLIIGRIVQIGYRLQKPLGFIEDLAVLNKDAIQAFFFQGENPYSVSIDPYTVVQEGKLKVYSGFKYPPLQIFYYGPFVALLGLKGIYFGNFFIYLGIGFFIFFALRKISFLHAAIGVIYYLSVDFFFTLAFNNGTNDFLPVLFLLLALNSLRVNKQACERKGLFLTALYLAGAGLCKQLPAGLYFIWFFVQGKIKIVFWSSLILILGILPFCLWDGKSFYLNVLEFNLLRPVRETSILLYFPELWQKIIPLAGILFLAVLAWRGRQRPLWNLENSWALPTWGGFIFLLTSKMTPSHYFVWVVPFWILFLLTPSLDAHQAD